MEIEKNIQVSVVMGSQSDWEIMQVACDLLEKLDVSMKKKLYLHTELQTGCTITLIR